MTAAILVTGHEWSTLIHYTLGVSWFLLPVGLWGWAIKFRQGP